MSNCWTMKKSPSPLQQRIFLPLLLLLLLLQYRYCLPSAAEAGPSWPWLFLTVGWSVGPYFRSSSSVALSSFLPSFLPSWTILRRFSFFHHRHHWFRSSSPTLQKNKNTNLVSRSVLSHPYLFGFLFICIFLFVWNRFSNNIREAEEHKTNFKITQQQQQQQVKFKVNISNYEQHQ